jgi:hypothetical protein
MAIIIPGSPGVPCNAKWYGAANVCPNNLLVCNFNNTGVVTWRQRVTFLGGVGDATNTGLCSALPTYVTRTANNFFIDVWTAYRAGAWTSSTTIVHDVVCQASTSAPHMQAHINFDSANPWYTEPVTGTGAAITCASGFTDTKTITLYDDGSYTIT